MKSEILSYEKAQLPIKQNYIPIQYWNIVNDVFPKRRNSTLENNSWIY